MLQLSRFSDVMAAVERGQDIAVKAYTLSDRLIRAFQSRALGGAHVSVTLEADPFGSRAAQLQRRNEHAAAQLRSCGIDTTLERDVHAKTIAVDGTVFFDESNWREGDLILRGDACDSARIAAFKSAALKDESAMLDCARTQRNDGVIVETETFDRCNVVSKTLREMAAQGLSPRLLIDERALQNNAKEAVELTKIAAEGVDVRVCDDSEKFALAGNRAWLGSANASAAWPGHDLTDWGVVTQDAHIVAAVRARVEARWASARPFCPLPVA